MNNLMIDIETLGTQQGSVILSIGAVAFDIETGKTAGHFYERIDIDSSLEAGLKLDKDTILWWLKQPKEAQHTIVNHTGVKLEAVLRDFALWVLSNCDADVKVWGNSARFDLGILQTAFSKFKMKLPWQYYHERDVRTLVAFAPEIKETTLFIGTKHQPVDDCMHQIRYCSKIYNKVNTALTEYDKSL